MVQPEAKPGDSVDTEPTPHRFASLAASPSRGEARFIGNYSSTLCLDKIDSEGSIMDRDKLGQSIVTGLVVLGIVGMTTALGEPRGLRGNWCGTAWLSKV